MEDRVSYVLRRAALGDAPVIREIFLASLTEHGFQPIATSPSAELDGFGAGDPTKDEFVAVADGAVIGFVILVPGPENMGELSKVFVDKAHRGQGVGTMLIDEAVAAGRARGYRTLFLSTQDAFVAARAYYERHGWTPLRSIGEASISAMQLHTSPPPSSGPSSGSLPPPSSGLNRLLALLDRFSRLREKLRSDLDAEGRVESSEK